MKLKFYLYLYNDEIYNDEKMEYLKKILFNNKKLSLIYFLLYRYMANCYKKPINKAVNYVKLKMQIDALTLKLSANNNKIDDLLNVDKNTKKEIVNNLNSINSNKENISKNNNEIYKKGLLITSNDISIYGHKKRLDVIEKDIRKISLNTEDIVDNKTNIDLSTENIVNNKTNIDLNTENIVNNKTNIENTISKYLILKIILIILIQI